MAGPGVVPELLADGQMWLKEQAKHRGLCQVGVTCVCKAGGLAGWEVLLG